ncbi:MAG: hypothetical protein RML72_09240 [Bacteroidia bacterium]|nr:hypothetical protein [Bacteroidia bacterium]MDW8159041.1 hypothetical protein [Bacteroidia bacterium]
MRRKLFFGFFRLLIARYTFFILFLQIACSTLPFSSSIEQSTKLIEEIHELIKKTPLGTSKAQLIHAMASYAPLYQDSLGLVYRFIYPNAIQYEVEFYFQNSQLTSIIINLECEQENKVKLLYLQWVEYLNAALGVINQGALGNYYWNYKNINYFLRLHPSQKIISLNILRSKE